MWTPFHPCSTGEHNVFESVINITGNSSYTELADPDRLVRDPLVSVMMTAYNHEPYIAQAIEGVLSQETDFPIELIVGEDCSTDRTREIVLEYQRRYPEIIRVLLSGKNVGMQENGTRTILAARGKYIAFCEGDDWWHRRDKLQLQIPAFRADNSLVCVAAEFQHISAGGQAIAFKKQSNPAQEPISVEYEDLVTLHVILYPCTMVARTDAVRRAMLGDTLCSDDSQLLGDLPLWLELSQLGRVMCLSETLATYRHTPNSASRQSDPLHRWRFGMSTLDIVYRALERYPLPGDASKTSNLKARAAWRILVMSAWVGDATTAREQWRRLRALGVKVRWREVAFVALALIPLPRRSLKVVLTKVAPHLKKRRMAFDLIKYIARQTVFPNLYNE
jgi:glycosyltransferase involved in cell wall biosynthesis